MSQPPSPAPAAPAPAPVTEAPPIDDALLAWLDAHAGKRRIALPLEITQRPLRNPETFIVGAGQRVPIALDSTALSMLLEDHLRDCCQPTGTVWVEGTWGAHLPFEPPTGPVFTVLKVGAPVTESPDHIRFVGP